MVVMAVTVPVGLQVCCMFQMNMLLEKKPKSITLKMEAAHTILYGVIVQKTTN
jgi:hypothetical protein